MKTTLLVTALAGLLAVPALAQDNKTVHVYNWSDYIAEDTVAKFEAATGYKVVYDVYDSNEVLEAKLLAGNSGYDVVVPTSQFLQRQVAAGVYQPLDKSKLPNLANMDPDLMKSAAAYDPDNEHSVIYMWGTTGIGYNVDKVKERLGDGRPRRQLEAALRSRVRREARRLRHHAARLGDRRAAERARLSRARPDLDQRRGLREGGEAHRGGAALYPLLPLVAVHQRPRQRRGLRVARLLGRHLHRRGAGRGGGQRHQDRLCRARGRGRCSGST